MYRNNNNKNLVFKRFIKLKVKKTKTVKATKRAGNHRMMEKSKFMLCVFAMSMLIFNPFNFVLNGNENFNNMPSDYKNVQVNGRTLNSIDSNDDIISKSRLLTKQKDFFLHNPSFFKRAHLT